MENEPLMPARASSPGKIISREMEARNMTVQDIKDKEVAEIVQKIINEQLPIDEKIAQQLSELFEISAQSWMNLENNFQKYTMEKQYRQ